VEVDANGKYVPGTTVTTLEEVQRSPIGILGSPTKLATRENGKWTFENKATVDLQQTLSNPNSMMNIGLRDTIAKKLQQKDNSVNEDGTLNTGANGTAESLAAYGATSVLASENQGVVPEVNEDGSVPIQAATPRDNVTNSNIPANDKLTRTDYLNGGEPLVYPLDLRKNKSDRIKFSMRTSEGAIIQSGLGRNQIERRSGGTIKGSVTLPTPGKIVDNNSVNFNEGKLNAFQSFLVAESLNLMGDDNPGEAAANAITAATEAFRKNTAYGDALKVYLAQQATSTQGLLSRATGAILNPNLELLFNAPELRDFSYVFRMSARSGPEAQEVKKIIRFFKQGMTVKATADATFLKSPNVFDIKYQFFDKAGTLRDNHPSIGRVKTCALTNCSVDYTPDGSYMTYSDDDRTMTSYQVTLTFKELTPIIESQYFEDGLMDSTSLNAVGF
tara:strand:- start:1073 stop:2407 length:1335 start_codon:yes stop_codon:yes gene_type:complete